jgi:hypothetical protein
MDRCPNCNHRLPPSPQDRFRGSPERDRESEMRTRSVRKGPALAVETETDDDGQVVAHFRRAPPREDD